MNFSAFQAPYQGTPVFPPLAIRFSDRRGTEGDDFLFGDYRNNNIYGLGGNDVLLGDSGNDSIYGMNGDDYLSGDEGDDYLAGGDGNDFIVGGSGSDYIVSGEGNDTLIGGAGNDTFYAFGTDGSKKFDGGEGDDLFIISANANSWVSILNYEAGDRIQVIGANQDYFVGSEILNSEGITEYGIYLNGAEQPSLLAMVASSEPLTLLQFG